MVTPRQPTPSPLALPLSPSVSLSPTHLALSQADLPEVLITTRAFVINAAPPCPPLPSVKVHLQCHLLYEAFPRPQGGPGDTVQSDSQAGTPRSEFQQSQLGVCLAI